MTVRRRRWHWPSGRRVTAAAGMARHRAYSKPAQQLLQTKFSDTSWAKQTPYWFDCQRNEWDKDYNKVAVCDAKAWPKQALPR